MTERAKRRGRKRRERTLQQVRDDGPALVKKWCPTCREHRPVKLLENIDAYRCDRGHQISNLIGRATDPLLGPYPDLAAAVRAHADQLIAYHGSQLWGDRAAPTKEFTGLASLIADHDPTDDALDDLLADAGVKDRPKRGWGWTSGMTLPIDRERQSPEWRTCDNCGQPIALNSDTWLDRNMKSACDGALIPPGRDLRPNPAYKHTPRSGYIDHDDMADT